GLQNETAVAVLHCQQRTSLRIVERKKSARPPWIRGIEPKFNRDLRGLRLPGERSSTPRRAIVIKPETVSFLQPGHGVSGRMKRREARPQHARHNRQVDEP